MFLVYDYYDCGKELYFMARKREKKDLWLNEKRLRNIPFLLYEDCVVTEKELEECKRILENMSQGKQSSSL